MVGRQRARRACTPVCTRGATARTYIIHKSHLKLNAGSARKNLQSHYRCVMFRHGNARCRGVHNLCALHPTPPYLQSAPVISNCYRAPVLGNRQNYCSIHSVTMTYVDVAPVDNCWTSMFHEVLPEQPVRNPVDNPWQNVQKPSILQSNDPWKTFSRSRQSQQRQNRPE